MSPKAGFRRTSNGYKENTQYKDKRNLMYLYDREMTTKLVFNTLILNLNKKKKQKQK